jgi:hypothetical protein
MRQRHLAIICRIFCTMLPSIVSLTLAILPATAASRNLAWLFPTNTATGGFYAFYAARGSKWSSRAPVGAARRSNC